MKKVLAFVLAAIMVCCVAFAANPGWVSNNTNNTTKDETTTNDYVLPTKKIVLHLVADKTSATLTNIKDTDGKDVYVCKNDGNFDITAGKNEVKVTFAKGADLIASQGWDTDGAGYAWVMKTKEDLNHVYKDVEIEISKIEFRAYGHNTDYVTLFDGSDNGNTNIKYAYGYIGEAGKPVEIAIDADNNFGATYDTLKTTYMFNVIKTIKDKDADPTYDLDIAEGCVINEKDSKVTATMISGNVFTVKGAFLDDTAMEALDKNVTNNRAKVMVEYNGLNLNAGATIKVTEAKDTYKAYAVDADGNVTALATKTVNGVMTFDVKNIEAFVVVDGTLTATGAANTTATSTNPNTGANDVMGVAAALAVVALVSGAAISLKK